MTDGPAADKSSMKNILAFAALILLLASCNRELNKDRSLVQIEIPQTFQKSEFNTSAIRCFAVNVTGTGIAAEKNACSPAVGAKAGFTSGGTVELEVERGEGRRIELYMMEVSDDGTCPVWDAAFQANGKVQFGRVYRVADKTVSVNQEVVAVELTVQIPASTQTLLAEQTACPKGNMQAKVLRNGDILNAANAPFSPDLSSLNVAGVTKADESTTSSSGNGIVTSGNFLKIGGFEFQLPEYLQSVSQKPDSKEIFGMLADGSIVRVDVSTGQTVDLTSTTCPFATCTIPVWAESFSAGLGSDLFFKDHGGQIYKALSGGGHQVLTPAVAPFVHQVVMF